MKKKTTVVTLLLSMAVMVTPMTAFGTDTPTSASTNNGNVVETSTELVRVTHPRITVPPIEGFIQESIEVRVPVENPDDLRIEGCASPDLDSTGLRVQYDTGSNECVISGVAEKGIPKKEIQVNVIYRNPGDPLTDEVRVSSATTTIVIEGSPCKSYIKQEVVWLDENSNELGREGVDVIGNRHPDLNKTWNETEFVEISRDRTVLNGGEDGCPSPAHDTVTKARKVSKFVEEGTETILKDQEIGWVDGDSTIVKEGKTYNKTGESTVKGAVKLVKYSMVEGEPGYYMPDEPDTNLGGLETPAIPVKVLTVWVDETGKVLKEEDGEHPDNTGEFNREKYFHKGTETQRDVEGNVKVVNKYVKKITTFLDKEGKEIKPKQDGWVMETSDMYDGFLIVKTSTKEHVKTFVLKSVEVSNSDSSKEKSKGTSKQNLSNSPTHKLPNTGVTSGLLGVFSAMLLLAGVVGVVYSRQQS